MTRAEAVRVMAAEVIAQLVDVESARTALSEGWVIGVDEQSWAEVSAAAVALMESMLSGDPGQVDEARDVLNSTEVPA